MQQHPARIVARTPHLPAAEKQSQILRACRRLEPIFQRLAARQHVPGIAYGVIVDGELIFTHSLGVGDVEGGTPIDADSVARIASMTKSFAALAIIMLRDAGQLRLDEAAATYVPELARWRNPTGDSAPISVRQLLTMSSGFPQDDPWADRQLSIGDEELSRLFRKGVSFSNPPGVAFEYSNYGYFLLGRIIANVSGVSAMDYITREILHPLGMTATTWQPAAVPARRRVLGYRWEDAQWKVEPRLPSGGDVAAFAGLSSSVRDLARWVALFQSAWPPRPGPERGIVRRSSLREMQQSWRMLEPTIAEGELGMPPVSRAGGYGFGLMTDHNGGYQAVGHGGGLPGFGSHMRWLPAYGVGIVALANVTYSDVHATCARALDELLGASQVARRRPVASLALVRAREQVIRLLGAWDEGLADRLFAANFFLDSDEVHWQRRLDELRRAHGALRPEGPFEIQNGLRGGWRMKGKRGWCRVFITMSPTVPPRVQRLELSSILPLSPAMRAAAKQLAALTSQPARSTLRRVAARDADREALWQRVSVAHALCGACKVGEVIAGNGAATATVRFVGAKRCTNVQLTLDPQSGKVLDAVFRSVESP